MAAYYPFWGKTQRVCVVADATIPEDQCEPGSSKDLLSRDAGKVLYGRKASRHKLASSKSGRLMDPLSAIMAFSVAAALMTITPGLDTALVLRTATVEGPRPAMAAGAGVVSGVLAWGLLTSLGLGVMLAMSEIGFRILQYAGAAYLIWLGTRMILSAFKGRDADQGFAPDPQARSASGWFWRGLMTNLLNPKVGVFYVSFLPQFIPADVPVVAFSVALAAIHAAMGLVWFGAITMATRPFSRLLRRASVTRSIDGLTGTVLIAFGARLLLERRA
jgi:threonine/homoserine/homoserine lactone efflux protein